MPVMDGFEACENLLSKWPDLKVIVLTMHDSTHLIRCLLNMGIHAFLHKNTCMDELTKALHSAVDKDFYFNSLMINARKENLKSPTEEKLSFGKVKLSAREHQIVRLTCEELSLKEIGDRLFISEHTVRNHRVNIMKKIEVKNMVGLVRYAYEAGWVISGVVPNNSSR
jgi:two-component system, NarL family, response regulator DegU